MVNLPELQIENVGNLSGSQIDQYGTDINAVANSALNLAHLYERGFVGVLNRHHLKSPEESAAVLTRARHLSEAGEFDAYVLIDPHNDRAVGMATLIADLALWRQRLRLPARLTRNSYLGTKIDNLGANAAAWVDVRAEDPDLGRLSSVYNYLRESKPRTWTIERVTQAIVHHALFEAGYVVRTDLPDARFDDYEVSKRSLVRTSRLFVGES